MTKMIVVLMVTYSIFAHADLFSDREQAASRDQSAAGRAEFANYVVAFNRYMYATVSRFGRKHRGSRISQIELYGDGATGRIKVLHFTTGDDLACQRTYLKTVCYDSINRQIEDYDTAGIPRNPLTRDAGY